MYDIVFMYMCMCVCMYSNAYVYKSVDTVDFKIIATELSISKL